MLENDLTEKGKFECALKSEYEGNNPRYLQEYAAQL